MDFLLFFNVLSLCTEGWVGGQIRYEFCSYLETLRIRWRGGGVILLWVGGQIQYELVFWNIANFSDEPFAHGTNWLNIV